MNKVYYEKVGRKYIPVKEYDDKFIDSFPKGHHLISVYPGVHLTRYNVDPTFAPLIAAGIVAEDVMAQAIMLAGGVRPSTKPITEEQKDAWMKLAASFGEENYRLEWPSAREVAEKAIIALQNEAAMLLLKPAVKTAYEEFMIICKLTKDTE